MENHGDGSRGFNSDGASDEEGNFLLVVLFPYDFFSNEDGDLDDQSEDEIGIEIIHYSQGRILEVPQDPNGPRDNISNDDQIDVDVNADSNDHNSTDDASALDNNDNSQEVSTDPPDVQAKGKNSGGSFR